MPQQHSQLNVSAEMQPVCSSCLSAIGYDPKKQSLFVQFTDGKTIWEYLDLPQAIYDTMMEAESIGSFFQKQIKQNPAYQARCITKNGTLVVVRAPSKLKPTESVECIVATPLYLALLKTKQMKAKGWPFPYSLWVACGKEPSSRGITRYSRCLKLIGEAWGKKEIGIEYLDKAIELAKERKI